jgi:hypothetical protein
MDRNMGVRFEKKFIERDMLEMVISNPTLVNG